jgi:hypothetical protein
MVAKILTSEVPFTSVNDQIYIDIDPVSFRVITSILLGVTTEMELANISDRELVLLVATARYLLCTELAEKLKSIQDGRDSRNSQLLPDNKKLIDAMNTQKLAMDDVNNSSEMKIGKGISKLMPMTKISCNMLRLTASQGCSCGSVALLIGSSFKASEGKIHCDSCCTDTIANAKYPTRQGVTATITSSRDLVSAVEQMTMTRFGH